MSKMRLIVLIALLVAIYGEKAHQNCDVNLTAQLNACCEMGTFEGRDVVEMTKCGEDEEILAPESLAYCNYSNIEEIMERKIAEKIRTLNIDFASTVQTINETLEGLREAVDVKLASCNGVVFERRCYIVITGRMKVNKASKICRKIGGKMSGIYSQQHYDVVMKYMPLLMEYMPTEIIIGMTFNPANSRVYLANGRRAPYFKWLSGWPAPYINRTQMAIRVSRSTSSPKGMFNHYRSYTYQGVLCRI